MPQKLRPYLTIKEWAEEDRPRERFLTHGSRFLSHAEILAILLGSGSRNQSALSLAQGILSAYEHDLKALSESQVGELLGFPGIGKAKAVSLLAAFEMGRRIHASPVSKRESVQDSEAAYAALQRKFGKLLHEEFWILYLNNANAVLSISQLSKGGITGTVVDIRLILKQALQCGAVGLIVAHNHPSGQLKPSRSDIALTQKLAKAATLVDIKLLDHLIITESSYFSFADEKLI